MDFLEILKIIAIGIIEGITEWLPISSTGHMLIFQEFVSFDGLSQEFMDMFNVVIQLGAIMAVVVIYFNKLWPFAKQNGKIGFDMDKISLWLKIIVACIPLGIAGILFEDAIDAVLMTAVVTAIALIFYGILFILIEKKGLGAKAKCDSVNLISYKTAFFGLFQLLSLVPGTSRSGATIIGGMLVGTSRVAAAEFTFYLGIPVMFGASLLKVVKYIMDGSVFTVNEILALVLGMVTAFATSMIAIKFLIGYIKKHNFVVFGWYRIALGCIVLLLHFLL